VEPVRRTDLLPRFAGVLLRRPGVAIVGARSAAQVDGFLGAMDFRLGDAGLAEIDAALPESLSLF